MEYLERSRGRSEISSHEVIRVCSREFRPLQVCTPNPSTFRLEPPLEMTPDGVTNPQNKKLHLVFRGVRKVTRPASEVVQGLERANHQVHTAFCRLTSVEVGGEENGGWMNAMKAFDLSRPTISSHAVGNARGALEQAIQYAAERGTFGKPIIKHQAISFMLADMATKVEAARLLTWKAAIKSDSGERNTLEAAHAKRFSADMAMEVTTDAVQIFGGYGYSEEYPVARRMRGAKVVQIFEGSSQIQRLIIGREMTRGN